MCQWPRAPSVCRPPACTSTLVLVTMSERKTNAVEREGTYWHCDLQNTDGTLPSHLHPLCWKLTYSISPPCFYVSTALNRQCDLSIQRMPGAFPGSPGVNTPRFQRTQLKFDPQSRNKDPTRQALQTKTKKKRRQHYLESQ